MPTRSSHVALCFEALPRRWLVIIGSSSSCISCFRPDWCCCVMKSASLHAAVLDSRESAPLVKGQPLFSFSPSLSLPPLPLLSHCPFLPSSLSLMLLLLVSQSGCCCSSQRQVLRLRLLVLFCCGVFSCFSFFPFAILDAAVFGVTQRGALRWPQPTRHEPCSSAGLRPKRCGPGAPPAHWLLARLCPT